MDGKDALPYLAAFEALAGTRCLFAPIGKTAPEQQDGSGAQFSR
ncbi:MULTISPECIES: hypothetical protein [unclassified Mesorhizobium]|nr:MULTISPECIES: hypothetical protein [unclassified Mesorhizobium]